jgi:uncharacterized protein YndB with AHSA1/START domain
LEPNLSVPTATHAVTHATFTIERSYPFSPERVFSAFSDPALKSQWFAEGHNPNNTGPKTGHFSMDFRVGGSESSGFVLGESSPFPGTPITNHTTYLDIVPNQRIVLAYTMSMGEYRFSASLATFEFLPNNASTRLLFTEQAAFFPNSDGAERRQDGWQKLLDALAQQLSCQ